jgi:hypothetical protein
MARQQADHLFKLVKSLTKAEKRNFKLYVNRTSSGEDTKFLRLFEIVDKQTEYNEEDILSKTRKITPSQLPNIKANLTRHILVSLQQLARQSDAEIMLRQQLDFAKILYNKALYRQALITLEKAKQQALKFHRSLLYYEMVEFEKQIESQYITRSIGNRAEEISEESDNLSKRLSLGNAFSNLSIRLYGFYLKDGYVRDEEDQIRLTEFFHSNLPRFKAEELGYHEKLFLYQAHVWYYLMMQDFLMVYRYSLKWVDLFKDQPELMNSQTDMYLKGMNNLLDGLQFIRDFNRYEHVFKELESLKINKNVQLTRNEEILLHQYYYTHFINWHFLEGTFTEGVEMVPEMDAFIHENSINLDNHIILVFYYKIACLYFGSGDHKNTLKYLNEVINYKDQDLRSDLQCFARILNLITHYEMENYDLMDYLIKSTYRFLVKMEDMHRVQKQIIIFLRRLPDTRDQKLTDAFRGLIEDLKKLQSDPYEKRAFLYLDIISWLESKVSGVPVQDVIREKRLRDRNGG